MLWQHASRSYENDSGFTVRAGYKLRHGRRLGTSVHEHHNLAPTATITTAELIGNTRSEAQPTRRRRQRRKHHRYRQIEYFQPRWIFKGDALPTHHRARQQSGNGLSGGLLVAQQLALLHSYSASHSGV